MQTFERYISLTKQEQLKDQCMSNKNKKMFSVMILICLHICLLNIGNQERQLRSSISHNSIQLRAEVFQSLLQSDATLGINCRSAHLTYGHMTLLTGPNAINWILFW